MSYPSGAWGFTSPGEVVADKVIIEGSGQGWFIYSGIGKPGNPPVAYGVAPGVNVDPFGNALPLQGGVVSYDPANGSYAALDAGIISFQGASPAFETSFIAAANPGILGLSSGKFSSVDDQTSVFINSGLEGGTLQVASGADGNTYDTMHLTAETTSTQGVNSTAQASIAGLSIPVSKGMTYDFEAEICFVGNAGNDAYLTIGGPATSSFIATIDYGENTGNVVQQTAINVNTGCESQPLNVGFVYRCRIWGRASFSASGNIVVSGAASANALTFTTQIGSVLTIRPVSGGTGSGGSGAGSGFGQLKFLVPSGDATGITDYAAISAVVVAGGTPWLTPGNWYTNTTLTFSPGQYMYGSGRNNTILHWVGTGDCVRAFGTGASSALAGAFAGITINGSTHAAGVSSGWHLGDMLQLDLDIGAVFFNQANDIGVWLDNQYTYTEQITGKVYVEGNSNNVVFDNSTGTTHSANATGSFDRCGLQIYVINAGEGNGVTIQNGAFIRDPNNMGIFGNFSTAGAAAVYTVLTITGSNADGNSYVSDGILNIGVELNGTSGNIPVTIKFGTGGSNYIKRCSGVIDFGGNNPFANAQNVFFGASGFGSFQYDGPVTGDTNLIRSRDVGQEPFNDNPLVNGSQITTQYSGLTRVSAASNVTGISLQGNTTTAHGDICTVINHGTGTITFDIPANSNVADGTSDVIQPNTAASYHWDALVALWFRSQ